ncbi:hydrogenase expression protein HyaE [Mesosutterella sp. OilRF-GAM-744-9]|uniref:Hydrogenase expression/formation protein n=1 Tax=Mesosutterella porci TaxID=2915351 RepID=A0ABS9MS26_9BURK|nr:hydrogenase expression protein HyaE [Mesosutterella sp. oilRF-744-WT-GAM-9]MCG5031421.1 hydrogenase expression protein HyaE [Mesosutterella sp. oilRF-744-WT-GAM-9]
MPVKLNEPTREITQVDVDRHPVFQRLWGAEGFTRVTEENLGAFASQKGLVLAVFADNPTTFKESIDIAVIAPEIGRAFGAYLSGRGFTDPRVGRAIASRYGLTRLPAVGFFRDGEFLGALQGLKGWSEYIQGLTEIGARQQPARHTISIQSN